jgi:isoquinoline 1-oxidoreductase alpha subunit
MQLDINGELREVTGPTDEPLLWVLRDELGLVGTRFGCGAGICGACTVHVDGEATRACVTAVGEVEGKAIRTIEGLAQGDTLHPMQVAFIEEQVPQCGWCMSGQIMTATAFVENNPTASDDDIVAAMSGNYCRCGCYVRIKRAVVSAAAEMRA